MPRGTRTTVRAAAAAALALAVLAAPLAAQDTIPRRDTARVPIPPEAVRADTLPDRTARPDTAAPDSTIPAPNFPLFPQPRARGFALGVWEWDRAALARFHGMGITELLESVPGLVMTRAGSYGQPAGVAAFAGGGGRLRVFVDGYELRPTEGSLYDLQRIPLLDLESLRVERGLLETRVEVATFRLSDRRPFAQIEGADGDYNSRFLRGFFARPLGGRVLVQVGLDLVETDGFRRAEPYAENTQLARLSYVFRPDLGVQLEYRSGKFDSDRRQGTTRFDVESSDRTEWILRGRGRLGRVWLDGQLGRLTREPQGADSLPAVDAVQALARAAVDVPLGSLTAAARLFRGSDDTFAPSGAELSLRAELTPAPWLAATGEVRTLTQDGEGGLELEGAARAGPFGGGFSLLGGFATGSRGIVFQRDSSVLLNTIGGIAGPPAVDTVRVPVRAYRAAAPSLTALRAGAEWARGSVRAGAAFVLHDAEQVLPYGLRFDRGAEPAEGGAASGVEAYLSVPLYFPGLRLDAWAAHWLDAADRPFLPAQQGWAALEFHRVFLNGQFEPTLRVETVARGPVRLLNPATGEALGDAPSYALFNVYVQLRILDVRIFYRLENLVNRNQAQDVPGRFLPGSRALYGLRWFFRN